MSRSRRREGRDGEGPSEKRRRGCDCQCHQHGDVQCNKCIKRCQDKFKRDGDDFSEDFEHNLPTKSQNVFDQENLLAQVMDGGSHDVCSKIQHLEERYTQLFEIMKMQAHAYHDVCSKIQQLEERCTQQFENMKKIQEEKGILPNQAARTTQDENKGAMYHLKFLNKPNKVCFTIDKIKADDNKDFLKIALYDHNNQKITHGDHASLMVKIVVLHGDFNADEQEYWTQEKFDCNVVLPRERHPVLLSGTNTIYLRLDKGEATLDHIIFLDNSSFTRTKFFKLGVKPADIGIKERILEGITKPFRVKDRRGKGYEKNAMPTLDDSISTIPGIGPKRRNELSKIEVHTMLDFLRVLNDDPNRLQKAFGKPKQQWKEMVQCAMKCDPGDERVFYKDVDQNTRIIFNPVYRVVGATFNGNWVSHAEFDYRQKEIVERSRKKHAKYTSCIQSSADLPILGSTSNHLQGACSTHSNPPHQQKVFHDQEFTVIQKNGQLTKKFTQRQISIGHVHNPQGLSCSSEHENNQQTWDMEQCMNGAPFEQHNQIASVNSVQHQSTAAFVQSPSQQTCTAFQQTNYALDGEVDLEDFVSSLLGSDFCDIGPVHDTTSLPAASVTEDAAIASDHRQPLRITFLFAVSCIKLWSPVKRDRRTKDLHSGGLAAKQGNWVTN